MNLEPEICYRAVQARDARYDGRFFTCVKSTGIFCRPICPARPPKPANCIFVPTAAAAQEAGYRPCLRCRPESSPELDAWRGTAATVSRASKLIEAGALDDGNVTSLAERLGIGERQLRRLFRQHLGAAPITVAQTRRVLLAQQLIHQTNLSMIEVAFASGFGSVRRFNETFQRIYQRSPSSIRRRAVENAPGLTILLPYHPPYDWDAIRQFLGNRAVDGLEAVRDGAYQRVIECEGGIGTVRVAHAPEYSSLRATIRVPSLQSLPGVIARLRRLFDLGADPAAIADVLSLDPTLAALVARRPGLRVPGAWDGFELAVRAVLGQQITVKGAVRLASRLVAACGAPVPATIGAEGFTHVFPRADQLRFPVIDELGMPQSRAETLAGIGEAAQRDPRFFDQRRSLADAVESLRSLRGIGEWTAQYIAMRAMGESDAFLVGDVGVQRCLAVSGIRPTAAELLERSAAWRPWRAYALLHLWTAAADNEPTANCPRISTRKETRNATTA